MIDFIGTDITNELIIVYTLIGLVIALIIIILIIDKIGNKKGKNKINYKLKPKEKIEKLDYEETVEEVVPIPTIPVVTSDIDNDNIDSDEVYHESDLEKTQAQIEVEEITKALLEAQQEERVDPYAKFEEEQEQNAIISYDELAKNFDRLYDEGEKIQYVEDDKLPINIDELYAKNEEILSPKKVKLDDLETVEIEKESIKEEKKIKENQSGFKSSPVISPVYGIQNDNINSSTNNNTNIKDIDDEIKKTNEFLKNLKELQKNLD